MSDSATPADLDQYPRDTIRDPKTMPPYIADPDGDLWLWTDADRRDVPGYQYAGRVTMGRSLFGVGPAHTREYVEGGHGCRPGWKGP